MSNDDTPEFEEGDPITSIEFHTEREMVMSMVALSLFQAKADSMAALNPQAAYDTACLFNVQHRAYSDDPELWAEATSEHADGAYFNGDTMSPEASVGALLEEERIDPAEYVAELHPDAARRDPGMDDGTDIDID